MLIESHNILNMDPFTKLVKKVYRECIKIKISIAINLLLLFSVITVIGKTINSFVESINRITGFALLMIV